MIKKLEQFLLQIPKYYQTNILSIKEVIIKRNIFLSIPTNAVSDWRSLLGRLKTYLSYTMGQTRLSSVASLYIEKDFTVGFDQVIDEFDS